MELPFRSCCCGAHSSRVGSRRCRDDARPLTAPAWPRDRGLAARCLHCERRTNANWRLQRQPRAAHRSAARSGCNHWRALKGGCRLVGSRAVLDGQRALGGRRPGPGSTGGPTRQAVRHHRMHHHQQGLLLWHEGHRARCSADTARTVRRRGGGRVRVDVQCAVHPTKGAVGTAHGRRQVRAAACAS